MRTPEEFVAGRIKLRRNYIEGDPPFGVEIVLDGERLVLHYREEKLKQACLHLQRFLVKTLNDYKAELLSFAMKDAPLDSEELNRWRQEFTNSYYGYSMLPRERANKFCSLIDHLQAVILHVTQDNGYEEGYRAGKEDASRKEQS